jgi:hypothetical protein
VSDPLRALELATGRSIADSGSGLPNIPAVPLTDDQSLSNFMSSVKAWLEAAAGQGMTGLATKQDLIDAGVLKQNSDGTIGPVVPASSFVPPIPSNLTATGAVSNIILQWDDPNSAYGNHAYTEVWASGTASFTDALIVGQSAGMMFAHTVGDDATRYYWVRFVSTSGVKGPFSDVSGTPGSTGAVDPAAVFAALHSNGSDNPFFTITAPTVINGVTVPAGTYIKDAFIAAATISNAMIRVAAIDSAKIADAAIVTAKINDAAITSAKIADASILTAKIADAQITGAKIDTATIGTANIANAAITAAKIADANITTAKIADAQITNAKIVNAAIDTLKVAGNSITISAYAESSSFPQPANNYYLAFTVTVNFTVAPTAVHLFLTDTALIYDPLVGGPPYSCMPVYITRDGNNAGLNGTGSISGMVSTPSPLVPIYLTDFPSAGTHTYSVYFNHYNMTYVSGKVGLLVLGTLR